MITLLLGSLCFLLLYGEVSSHITDYFTRMDNANILNLFSLIGVLIGLFITFLPMKNNWVSRVKCSFKYTFLPFENIKVLLIVDGVK